ncbi:MAG: hypothetical protein ACJ8DI_00595 [Ktedonobacteraceae bacterium]
MNHDFDGMGRQIGSMREKSDLLFARLKPSYIHQKGYIDQISMGKGSADFHKGLMRDQSIGALCHIGKLCDANAHTLYVAPNDSGAQE